jgi:hypothetical protein
MEVAVVYKIIKKIIQRPASNRRVALFISYPMLPYVSLVNIISVPNLLCFEIVRSSQVRNRLKGQMILKSN